MREALLTAPGRIEHRDKPWDKELSPGEVRIRIASVGICGSDIHYFRHGGIGEQRVQYPFRMGHECSGTIEAVNDPESILNVSDKVAIDPLVSCGTCFQCESGRLHTCLNQVFLGSPGQLSGALAEYLDLPSANCFKIPQKMSSAEGVMVEPLSIAIHAARFLNKRDLKTVGIIGCGPIGLCVLEICKLLGAGEIYATDKLNYRVDLAKERGAQYAANPLHKDIAADINSLSPQGCSAVFECAGEQDAMDQGLELLQPGGILLQIGIPQTISFKIDPHLCRRKEIRIQNVRRQNNSIREAIDYINTKQVHVGHMITHQFDFDYVQEAFELVEQYGDEVVKALVNI